MGRTARAGKAGVAFTFVLGVQVIIMPLMKSVLFLCGLQKIRKGFTKGLFIGGKICENGPGCRESKSTEADG